MKDTVQNKLSCVPKDKILNLIKVDKLEKNRLSNKSKKDIINYCLKNNLLSSEQINSLYTSYKNSINSVLYLLESNIKNYDFNKLNDSEIEKAIKKINEELKEKPIKNFKLEALDKTEEYIKISFTYTKEIRLIYAGNPKIKGYKSGDIINIDSMEEASVFHFKLYNRFIIKCNDTAAMKNIKKIISKVFMITLYHPKFDRDMIEKMTLNPDGKNHAIKASFQNVDKKDKQPGLISVSDENLDSIEMFEHLENSEAFNKIYNCFKVEINGTPRFVAISNLKGKLWIPAYLNKLELEDYIKAILEKIELSLNKLREEPLKYINFYSNYEFDTNLNKNSVLKRISRLIVEKSQNINENLDDDAYYELIRYCKNDFYIYLNDYVCEEDGYVQALRCPECGKKLMLLTTNNKGNEKIIYVKCDNCSYKKDILKHCENERTFCCDKKFNVENYSDIITIVPKKRIVEKIKAFLDNINYPSYRLKYFYIFNGMLKLVHEEKGGQIIKLNEFKPFQKILNISSDNKVYGGLKKLNERCLVYNPKAEFCMECNTSKLGTSLDNVEIGSNKLHKNNKQRFCLPRLFGYCINLTLEGIHHGAEKADIKFLYDKDSFQISDYHEAYNQRIISIGIHVKAAAQNEPKNCNNPKITSAIGHIVTSAQNDDFDIIGFAMPNELNEDIMNELRYLSNGLGIKILIVDKEDWIKMYMYYLEQRKFDKLDKSILNKT